MTSASSASKRVIGPMNADTGVQEDQEAEVIREDIRKLYNLLNILVALDQEIEDIEADLDLTGGTTLVKRVALNAVRQGILRETVLK